MTKEDKELLLKDLSARLPYGVIVDYSYNVFDVHNGNYIKHGSKCILKCYLLDVFMSPRQNENGEYIKPYLRPMSSMTEEEEINLYKVTGFYYLSNNELLKDEWRSFKNSIKENKLFFPYPIWLDDLQKVFDWLNAHHFDYRGLIEKGLAIEALEGMYNIN